MTVTSKLVAAPSMERPSRSRSALLASAFVVGIAAALLPSSAHAGYYVYSYANLRQNGFVTYSYNDPGHTGAYSTSSCSNPGQTCTAGGSGSTDTTGGLTASNDQVTYSDTLTNRFNQTSNQSGAASAYANLATGKIGAYGTGTYLDFYGTGGQDGVISQSNATIDDTLHISFTTGNAATVHRFAVTFAIDGSVASPTPHGPEGVSIDFGLDVGAARWGQSVVDDHVPDNNSTGVVVKPATVQGFYSYSYAADTPSDIRFTGVYQVTGTSADVEIKASMRMGCGGGQTCDYSHTGALSLDLGPDGSFTSDSGVFLSGPGGTSVPEPASIAMLAFGLAAVAGFRRRGS